jgi:putative GTP pyrophosphokinase
MPKLPPPISKQIKDAVKAYVLRRSDFEADATNLQNRLLAHHELKKLIHSLKWRSKDPDHLRDKLERKARLAVESGGQFLITAENLFDHISDLSGVRLLHLHMLQMERIHPLIVSVFAEEGYVQAQEPEAKTWDPEYEKMFQALAVKVHRNESLYTSVHYVVKQNSASRRQCELQVRTLAEELWGEVSHTINYPRETDSIACKEQLKVLARLVSGSSRLVDSIFVSFEDHKNSVAKSKRSKPSSKTRVKPKARRRR